MIITHEHANIRENGRVIHGSQQFARFTQSERTNRVIGASITQRVTHIFLLLCVVFGPAQDRSFTCFIKSSEKDFKKIYDVVTTRGALKLKGYFRAFISEEKKLVVLLNKMLPTPPW